MFLCVAYGMLPCNKQVIIDCMNTHLDKNGDGHVDAEELDSYINTSPCGLESTPFSGIDIITMCDYNHNGYLDSGDFDINNGCAHGFVKYELCRRCHKCDVYKKK